MTKPTPHLEIISEAQQPIWIPMTALEAVMPNIGKRYTIGYVHQLMTVMTCAVRILPAMTGSASLAVASERPTRSSYTMYRKKDMERNQHIQRGVRSPVTTNSP